MAHHHQQDEGTVDMLSSWLNNLESKKCTPEFLSLPDLRDGGFENEEDFNDRDTNNEPKSAKEHAITSPGQRSDITEISDHKPPDKLPSEEIVEWAQPRENEERQENKSTVNNLSKDRTWILDASPDIHLSKRTVQGVPSVASSPVETNWQFSTTLPLESIIRKSPAASLSRKHNMSGQLTTWRKMRSGSSMSLVSLDDKRDRYTLRTVLAKHRPEVESDLKCTATFLSYLTHYRLVEDQDVDRFQREDASVQNKHLIDAVARRSMLVTDSYSKFIDALNRSQQGSLASLLTSIDKEIQIVEQHQDNLVHQLENVDQFLEKESRRVGIIFTSDVSNEVSQLPTPYSASDRGDVTSFLYKVHQTTKNSIVQFKRCQEVIDKLHTDCNEVAHRNTDMLSKLRECDDAVQKLVPDITTSTMGQDHSQSLVLSNSSQTKTDEARNIVSSIQARTSRLDEAIRRVEDDHEATKLVLQSLLKDIKVRNELLSKVTKSSEAGNKSMANSKALVPFSHAGVIDTFHSIAPMQDVVEELARELLTYTDNEKQLHNHHSLNHSTGKGGHRHFDQIDKDLYHLAREVRQKQNNNANVMVNHVIRTTKSERQDCVRLVNEVEKMVKARRKKLTDGVVRSNSIKHRRSRPSKSVDSNLWKRLVDLQKEVEIYTGIEQDLYQRQKSDRITSQRGIFKETQLKSQKIRDLERKVRVLDSEKERYRKLYNQEKGIKSTTMLRKAVIPIRRPNSLSPLHDSPSERKPRPILTVKSKHLSHMKVKKEAIVKPRMRTGDEIPFLQIRSVGQGGVKEYTGDRTAHEIPLESESSFKLHNVDF